MKTNRIVIIVLSLVIVWLAYLALFSNRKGVAEKSGEMWHTNTVEVWYTNTIAAEKWRTNTIELVRTNTVLQPVTNEVTKEVPARLSEQERRAAMAGFKFLNAPAAASGAGALYKASPIAVEVSIEESAKRFLNEDNDAVKKQIAAALTAKNVPVAEKSPYHLGLTVDELWSTDVPRVSLLSLRLELRENVALQRQGDIIQCAGTVWSTSAPQLVRIPCAAEDLQPAVESIVEKFYADCQKAKERQKDMESRFPAIPGDFLSGTK